MGFWDMLWIGMPIFAALMLLVAAAIEGLRTKNFVFLIPGGFAVCAILNQIYSLLDADAISCIGAFGLLVFGVLAYIATRRAARKRAASMASAPASPQEGSGE